MKKQTYSVCEEKLYSDAEGHKNVGCDLCPRSFHLNCTEFTCQAYDDVANREFLCDFCN